MNRRTWLAGSAFGLVTMLLRPGWAQTPAAGIEEMEQEIATRRASGRPVTCDWVVELIGQRPAVEVAICVFELVRRIPYRLGRWSGDPDSLFNLGAGDCRHKAAAQRRTMSRAGLSVRPVKVLFNWADLPIPSEILSILSETRGFHDTVEVNVSERWMLADATWDPPLARVGFPVMASWGGMTPTLGVTEGALQIFREGGLPADANPYDYFGVRWPERARTNEFNTALNAWMQSVREAA